MSDATLEDLSEEERREYLRSKRRRLDSCEDGCCGGCPACLDAQGISEEEE